jgi:hypothetical protein
MAEAKQPRNVLPRPRILQVMGILNIVVASALILMSLYLGIYSVLTPMTTRAMTEVKDRAAAADEARKQAELEDVARREQAAASEAEKVLLQKLRATIKARRSVTIPIGMDLEKLGWGGGKMQAYAFVDAGTALALDALMIAAGIAMIRRRSWGLRAGLWAALGKIVRLVLVYGYAALVLVPPLAQASGKLAGEMVVQQQKAAGGPMPPIGPAFFTRMYYIMYTGMAVSMMLFGSIYPAISLWFLSRPGAWAACDERAVREPQAVAITRGLGILNVVFASCLILFGLCLGAYITLLPMVGKIATQAQGKAVADMEARRASELKIIAEAEEKASTEEEKKDLAAQRAAIEERPRLPNTAGLDFSQMGLNEPRVRVYYWVELATGFALNLAMLIVGIALLRRRSWAVPLGIGVAGAKIVRLVLLYSYFLLAVGTLIAQQTAKMVGGMMVQPALAGAGAGIGPAELDVRPLAQVYEKTYVLIAVVMIVAGSIYPAVSIWLLGRVRAAAKGGADGRGGEKPSAAPGPEWSEVV